LKRSLDNGNKLETSVYNLDNNNTDDYNKQKRKSQKQTRALTLTTTAKKE